MKAHSEAVERFKGLLKVLFQFDAGDLDFGIYRIMNYRRKEIEAFIEKDLVQAVEKEFEKFVTQSQEELLAKIDEKKKEIEKLEKDLGEKILKNRQIEDKFKDRPFAREYLELKKQLEAAEVTESTQAQVFNDLYTFFSRYYEDGDFISKRRYSSRDTRYAIPYNGEEVKLYWANFDQYYVKTGEVFKDYEFSSNGWRIVFRTTFADVEAGNIKGSRRYFVLAPSDAVTVDKESKTCLIQFEYRPLTDEDHSKYKVTTKSGEEKKTAIQQDELNSFLVEMILGRIKDSELKAILSEKPDEKTVLAKHLYKYTRKITSDFFIHKNLKAFLERELDYFIKTEVLDIHNLDPRHVTRAKVVENIGKRIIEFLAQIEDYQKLLWEKKKFVLRTDYVITTDRMPEEFLEEVLGCEAQLQEWQDLGFGQISEKKDLNGKKLPVDTKHFDGGFKERLLEKLSEQGNLDDLIDGILIKSENWQALNLLLSKYKGKIQCIYIDPPFNTGSDEFIYKDHYQHSSWLAMMHDRLSMARDLLHEKGNIYVQIGSEENSRLRILLDEVFGAHNFRNEIIWKRLTYKQTQVKGYGVLHDTILYFSKSEASVWKDVRADYDEERLRKYFCWVETPEGQNIKLTKGQLEGREPIPQGRRFALNPLINVNPNRPNLRYEFCGFLKTWKYTQEKMLEYYKQGVVFQPAPGALPQRKQYLDESKGMKLNDMWVDISAVMGGSDEYLQFETQKPEKLLARIIEVSSGPEDYVLDYFLGSGTTTAAAHKLGRKWIGVEMANCFGEFYTDRGQKKIGTLGRMKKVLAGDKAGISKEVNWQGGGFFKYQYLEQYEDTLHNIEFPNEGKGQLVLKLFPEEASEYIMRYMLRHETEGSPSLLNVNQFENPLEYKLRVISDGRGGKIVPVDLVETFNYLLGLRVSRYKFLSEHGRKYAIVLGERGSRRAAVVWRPTKDIDLQKDREVIENAVTDSHPDEIFINGDALIKDYKVIESEFKALMGV